MSTKKQILVSVAIVLAAGAVVAFTSLGRGDDSASGGGMEGHDHAAMSGGGEDEKSPVRLAADAARRIGVKYAVAERKFVERSVETVGSVTYDETRIAEVNPKIEGWIERLYVDFTGAPVRRGQPLLALYSPKLVAAQEELILARRLVDEAAAGPESRTAERSRQLLEAARRRLSWWDVPAAEIRRIEETGQPTKTLTLRAPASGIVVEKNVFEGGRIAPGMNLYRIADLSSVWVDGEVFEKDLSLVREGQPARVSVEAYPGETFAGAVTYVYPTVSLEARTARVRIELANPEGRLKPGMYARVSLAVPTGEPRLVVPRDAVHATGERAWVFVRGPDRVLLAREVETGLVTGGEIEILSGLEEGDAVVASANFLIDAESSMGGAIEAMPGMEMEGEAADPPTDADPHAGYGS
ncbi:MAG: efflux RND transporter periplasmic adaptor subunit [Gemmatimonadota bacterium]|nr:efflux RND transporter periplasmic adaptor subunit [Gemmatimonadota bacterium]